MFFEFYVLFIHSSPYFIVFFISENHIYRMTVLQNTSSTIVIFNVYLKCVFFFYSVNVFLAHLSRRLKWAFLIACRPSSVCPYTFRILIFFSRANGPISTKLGTIILNIFITDPCKMTWLCWLQEVFILGLTSNSIFSTLIVAKWHD